MAGIKKVILDCFKYGKRSIRMDMGFKTPGLYLPSEEDKSRDLIKVKLPNWCTPSEYDQIVVSYKSPFEGEQAFIFTADEFTKKETQTEPMG